MPKQVQVVVPLIIFLLGSAQIERFKSWDAHIFILQVMGNKNLDQNCYTFYFFLPHPFILYSLFLDNLAWT